MKTLLGGLSVIISLVAGGITTDKVGNKLGYVIYKEDGIGRKHPIIGFMVHLFGMAVLVLPVMIGTMLGLFGLIWIIRNQKRERRVICKD